MAATRTPASADPSDISAAHRRAGRWATGQELALTLLAAFAAVMAVVVVLLPFRTTSGCDGSCGVAFTASPTSWLLVLVWGSLVFAFVRYWLRRLTGRDVSVPSSRAAAAGALVGHALVGIGVGGAVGVAVAGLTVLGTSDDGATALAVAVFAPALLAAAGAGTAVFRLLRRGARGTSRSVG